MTFHPEALCLYCGCENQLRVYGWEPAKCFDTLTTGWGRVCDIAIAQKQLVCISFICFQSHRRPDTFLDVDTCVVFIFAVRLSFTISLFYSLMYQFSLIGYRSLMNRMVSF